MHRLQNSAISSEFLNSNKVLTFKNVIECLYCFSFFFFAVDISLQNATIFVNFPFLFRLLEFFTSPTPAIQKQHDLVTTASQTSLDNFVPPNAISTGTEVTDVPRREQDRGGISRPEAVSQVDAAVTSSQASLKIVAHGVVKDPDIVLLSDATNKDSEALIVQVS